jgi:hypothetical protein
MFLNKKRNMAIVFFKNLKIERLIEKLEENFSLY